MQIAGEVAALGDVVEIAGQHHACLEAIAARDTQFQVRAPQQIEAGVGIAGVLPGGIGAELQRIQIAVERQFDAIDRRSGHIHRLKAVVALEGHQIADAGAIEVGAEAGRADLGVETQLQRIRALGIELRVAGEQTAEARRVQFIEVGCPETLTPGQIDPARIQPPAQGGLGRGLAAESVVLVVAQRQLVLQRAVVALPAQKYRLVVQAGAVGGVAAETVDAVAALALGTEAEDQMLGRVQLQIVHPVQILAAGDEAREEHRRGQIVAGATQGQTVVPVLSQRPFQRQRDGVLAHIGQALIELHVLTRGQAAEAELLTAQLMARPQSEIAMAVAIIIRVVAEIAGQRGRKAIVILGAHLHAETASLTGESVADGASLAAVAAQTQQGAGTAQLTGGDRDHAADGIGTVVAGARTAHDLDALDLVQGQVFPGGSPGVAAGDAHAVNQKQHLIGIGAAKEQAAGLTAAAGARQIHARLQAQQIQQIRGLTVLDLGALDDTDIGQCFSHRTWPTTGGDRHRIQRFRGSQRHGGRDGRTQNQTHDNSP